jgi:hypothetical protein
MRDVTWRNRQAVAGLQTLARLVLDGQLRGIDPTSWDVTPHGVSLHVKWPDSLVLAGRILPDAPMQVSVAEYHDGPCTHRVWDGTIGDVRIQIRSVTTEEEEGRPPADDQLEPIDVLDVLIASTLPDDDATVGAE